MSQFQRHTDHDVDRSDGRLELSGVVSQLQRRRELTIDPNVGRSDRPLEFKGYPTVPATPRIVQTPIWTGLVDAWF